MDAENKETILIGDYNCNWDPNHSNRSAQTGKLKDLATRYQFERLIKLDTLDSVGISDHSLIYIHRKISISRKQPKIINTRKYKLEL